MHNVVPPKEDLLVHVRVLEVLSGEGVIDLMVEFTIIVPEELEHLGMDEVFN